MRQLVFNRDELPWSKGETTSHQLERNLQTNIVNMYQERRALLRTMILQASNGRKRLMRMLRFEELTAYLNYLSGDLFDSFQALKSYHKVF